MAVKQNLVVTQKRVVTKLSFNNESGSYSLGLTGSCFDALAGVTNESYPAGLPSALSNSFVAGITFSSAAISRILWTSTVAGVGYNLTWAGSQGATAIMLYGQNGEYNFEKLTLRNNATAPTGILTVTPTATTTGTLILEIVQSSGSVGNTQ